MKKLLNFIKNLFFKPSTKIGLGILIGIGFIAGAVSWQKLNDVLDETSTEEFCVSCHSMQTPLKESHIGRIIPVSLPLVQAAICHMIKLQNMREKYKPVEKYMPN